MSEVRRSPFSGCPPPGGCRGPPPTCCRRGCAGLGAQHCPFGLHALVGAACRGGGGNPSTGPTAWCSCEPPLRTVGAAEGRPLGGCRPLLSGGSEFRRFPFSGCLPSGQAAGARYPRAVGAGVLVWGPSTVPLALGRGAGLLPLQGGPASGAVPPPAARPLGRAARVPRPASPGCGWCRRGGPAPAPRLASR